MVSAMVIDDFGPPERPGEEQALGDLLAETYGVPRELIGPWFDYAGRQNLRVLREDGQVAAGLIRVPMGQFWGRRSIRTCGVAGVGTSPALRGKGLATRLMHAAVSEMRAEGFPLAALYPSTQPLYRRAGFEQAGTCFRFRAPPRSLTGGDRALPMRSLTIEDLPAVEALYRQVASSRDGWLDRGSYIWHRVRFPRGRTVHGYVVGETSPVDGYIFLSRSLTPDGFNEVGITDLAARSPAGWRRLLAFLADHGSMTSEVGWFGGTDEPLLHPLAEVDEVKVEAHITYMLRVLHLQAALTARGYPVGLCAELELDVVDPLFEENAGRWRLRVKEGRATVERGGDGALGCDVRSLATLFSGFRSATALAELGLLTGPASALAAADAVFAGRPPSMRETF
jgi:predicted acetyltransferase